jgi:hypothetical protein
LKTGGFSNLPQISGFFSPNQNFNLGRPMSLFPARGEGTSNGRGTGFVERDVAANILAEFALNLCLDKT